MIADEIVSDWEKCYGEAWSWVSKETMSHPAKFSRALIRRIYRHAIEEGWLKEGDTVVDPFGGVALGAFDALQNGINWVGCELEPRFVEIGNRNIDRWNHSFKNRLRKWADARLIQGDSRQLCEVIQSARCCISSPPYDRQMNQGGNTPAAVGIGRNTRGQRPCEASGEHNLTRTNNPDNPLNLGNMKATESGFQACVSSPPFSERHDYKDPEKSRAHVEKLKENGGVIGGSNIHQVCGNTDGNLSVLKATDEGFQACVSSPPYIEGLGHGGKATEIDKKKFANCRDTGQSAFYGKENGQLGAMREGDFAACISSPPYEASRVTAQQSSDVDISAIPEKLNNISYGITTINRTVQDRDDFWIAARQIVEQVHSVLVPDGMAIFVCKRFVRKGQIVEFPEQWAQLCEAVGFERVCWHRAWLVESQTHENIFGDTITTTKERKSFFRRLAEQKGSPRIDWEDVQCFRRIG